MKKVIINLLCLVFIFGGCSKNTVQNETGFIKGSQTGEADKIDKKEDGSLCLSMRTAKTLNPLLNEDSSIDTVLKLVFKPLIAISDDYKPTPSIAESWYFSDEGHTLTLNLKKGLKWHNGNDITSDDVIFSVNTLLSSGENTVYKDCVSNIARAEKTDTYTSVIKFKEANCGNVYALSFPLIPISYYGNSKITDLEKSFSPVGNGEYRFESYTAPRELKLKATDNSFSKKPNIENIVVNITNSSDTDIYMFNQRITDCVVADYNILGKSGLDKNSKKFSFIDNYYDFIGFNFQNSILNNKSVRKAVAYALPIESIIEGVYLSNAVEAKNPLNPDSWLNDMESSKYSYNLAKAKEYLDIAGFKLADGKRVREKMSEGESTSLSFSLLVNKENLQRSQAAVKIAEELNGIGFNIHVEKVAYEEYTSRLENGQFDMFLGGWSTSIVPEFGYMFQTGSDRNYINYSSEKMDNLINEYRKSISETNMKQNMKNLTNEVEEELPYVSLVFRKSALFLDNRVSGEIDPNQFNYLNGIENWYIN